MTTCMQTGSEVRAGAWTAKPVRDAPAPGTVAAAAASLTHPLPGAWPAPPARRRCRGSGLRWAPGCSSRGTALGKSPRVMVPAAQRGVISVVQQRKRERRAVKLEASPTTRAAEAIAARPSPNNKQQRLGSSAGRAGTNVGQERGAGGGQEVEPAWQNVACGRVFGLGLEHSLGVLGRVAGRAEASGQQRAANEPSPAYGVRSGALPARALCTKHACTPKADTDERGLALQTHPL